VGVHRVQRIRSDDHTGHIDALQQDGQHRYLVGLRRDVDLTNHDTVGVVEGAQRMLPAGIGVGAALPVAGAAQGLPVGGQNPQLTIRPGLGLGPRPDSRPNSSASRRCRVRRIVDFAGARVMPPRCSHSSGQVSMLSRAHCAIAANERMRPCNRAHRERQHDREPVPYTATGRGSGTRPRISSNEATSGPGTESPTATNRRNWFKAGAIGKDAGRAVSPRSEPAWCARLSDFCDLPGARSAWWRDLMP